MSKISVKIVNREGMTLAEKQGDNEVKLVYLA